MKGVESNKKAALAVSWGLRCPPPTSQGGLRVPSTTSAAVRGVYVHDLSGTPRDDYLYSTDPSRTPEQLLEEYTGRWHSETLFAQRRAYLGLATTRGGCPQTVSRAAPSLFGR